MSRNQHIPQDRLCTSSEIERILCPLASTVAPAGHMEQSRLLVTASKSRATRKELTSTSPQLSCITGWKSLESFLEFRSQCVKIGTLSNYTDRR